MSRVVIVGVVLAVAVVAGGMLIQSGSWTQAAAAPASAHLLEQVVARVSRDFIDTIEIDDLYRRAATGLVREADEAHGELLSAEAFGRLREATSGRYAGIGVEIGFRDGAFSIIAPIAGTPADSAGLMAGDHVVAVNGKTVVGLTMAQLQSAMRGAPGSVLRLAIERGGQRHDLVLRRREIVLHPVQRARLITPTTGYVELATFSSGAARELQQAIERLRSQGATSLILDLRSNPGGLLEQGIAVADLFLDRGTTLASTRGRVAEADHDFEDVTPQRWPAMLMVALVDSGSASAAEIVAGALQDNRRAPLVGTRTYGKGSAQTIFPVTGGRALKLTTARWYTPDGRSIEGDSTRGIEPDVDVGKSSRAALPRIQRGVEQDPAIITALSLLGGARTTKDLWARVTR